MVVESGKSSAARLRSAGTVIQSRVNMMINKAKEGTIAGAKLADKAITGAKNLDPRRIKVMETTLGNKVIVHDPAENTHTFANKISDIINRNEGVNLGGGTKGTGKETYQHLKDYKNNKYFTRTVEYNAGKDGTGFTYKVYQRGDINWDMVRTKGAKKGRGLTNAEASVKYGLAPILDDAGSVATLHHSQQKGVGPLYEASTRYHNISNAKRAPLHPYKGKLNPFYPMDETARGAFQKVDSINYWKIRGEEALGGK